MKLFVAPADPQWDAAGRSVDLSTAYSVDAYARLRAIGVTVDPEDLMAASHAISLHDRAA